MNLPRLNNGAQILTMYFRVYNSAPNRPEGVVLARWRKNEFVTWNCYPSEQTDGWDCETGHYFSFVDEMDMGRARQEAEIDFGRRVCRMMSANEYNGARKEAGDAPECSTTVS